MGLTLGTSGWPTFWFWGGLPCKKRHAEEGILHILGSSLTCRCVWASHSRRMCTVEETQYGAEAPGTLLLSRDWRSAQKHVFPWCLHASSGMMGIQTMRPHVRSENARSITEGGGREVPLEPASCEEQWLLAQMPVRLNEVAALWSQVCGGR